MGRHHGRRDLLVLRFGGLRVALITLSAFATFALTGLWEESMQTLSLMLVAVALSLAIGIPLGIVAGRSDRFARAVTPVLDAMQIVPAFAYLMPVVILFSIGPAAAVVSTMIYAIPPSIRITALGVRGVAVNTVEAATSMGATRSQLLRKVQLPLARRMILLGVNQTILFALSMVVIAGLIGGGGLGAVVTNGIYSNPALAILAGLVIVVLAMALDRSTEAMAARTDPAQRHLDETRRRRLRIHSVAIAAAIPLAIGLSKALGAAALYPDEVGDPRRSATLEEWLLAKIQVVLDYVQDPTTWVFASHRARWRLHPPAAPAAAAGVPRRGAVVHDGRRPDVDRVGDQRTSPRADHARDARSHRIHGCLGACHGHALTGARRHGDSRRASGSCSACWRPRTTASPRR